ncbi:MAG: beta-lactamase family protein [Firmicutes bacterium]|nr:beta-lactamase family protein [Bacillota bacterium]
MCKKTLQSGAKLLSVVVLSLLIFFTVTSCSNSDSSNQSGTFSQAQQEQMKSVVDTAVAEGNIPGIVVAVWQGDKEWIYSYGKSDINTGAEMNPSLNFRIGSITKSFTATIILQLVDEGKIGLDDPVSNYVSDIPNGENITIRELLNMSSGLFGYSETDGFIKSYTEDPLQERTPQELVALGVNDPQNPVFEPGKGFNYSNTNYVILGEIIENITGNKVEDEIRNRIAKPLKLNHTYLPETPYMPAYSCSGYYYDPKTAAPLLDLTNQSPSLTWTAGGVISNLSETKTYIRAIGDGTLISSEMQAERLTFNPYTIVKDRYGYGLGVSWVNGYIGHNGSIPGYNSSAYYSPDSDTTVIIFANEWKIPNLNLGTDTIFVRLGKILSPNLDWNGLE